MLKCIIFVKENLPKDATLLADWEAVVIFVTAMRHNSSTLYVIVLTALSLVLTGCGAKRRTVVSGGAGKVIVVRPPSEPPVTGNTRDSNDADLVARLIDGAYSWIGTPYRYGGADRNGTDCSGFVQRLFADIAAVSLPRNTRKQAEFCSTVQRKHIQPGDLLFFDGSTVGAGIGHVGLYVGDGRMIHASSSRGVIVSGIDEAYYNRRYRQAGRVGAISYASRGHKPGRHKQPNPVVEPEVLKATLAPDGAIIIPTDISALLDSAFAAMPDSILGDWMD